MPSHSTSKEYIHQCISRRLDAAKKKFNELAAEVEKETKETKTYVELAKIMASISRLEKALSLSTQDFGMCVKCEKAIEISRLDADPSTNLCAKCAPPKQICTVLPFIKKTS